VLGSGAQHRTSAHRPQDERITHLPPPQQVRTYEDVFESCRAPFTLTHTKSPPLIHFRAPASRLHPSFNGSKLQSQTPASFAHAAHATRRLCTSRTVQQRYAAFSSRIRDDDAAQHSESVSATTRKRDQNGPLCNQPS
jgi:hypothetical protein